MTRSRKLVLASLLVVAAGSAAALGALFLDPARASVGPLPAEALVLPADSTFVVGLDVKRFTASPFYKKYGRKGAPPNFEDLEAKTGINPERDLERVVLAGNKAMERGEPLALVSGSFDRYKLGRALETKKGVTWKKDHGATLYLFAEGGKGAHALAFLDDHTLLLGGQGAVEATLASHAEGTRALRTNALLMDLLSRVKPGSTFWMVGDQALLANLPKTLPTPGGGQGSSSEMTLPALKTLTVTGDLDPVVSFEITGGASDEAAAKNLADIVRGLVAMAALQANQRPELKSLASAVSVTTESNQVHVSARFPYELLDTLQPKAPPAP
jgi:hypothetical protein